MTLLRDAPNDFAALIERVAAHLAYPPAFVERDYWVTEILRSIALPIPDVDARVVFKGGTSLSKAWQLIQRMSEDVDIVVVFGSSATGGDRNRVLRLLIDRAAADTGLTPTGVTGKDGIHRARTFEYPQVHSYGALTGRRVLVELGIRGGPEPHRRLNLRSYLAEIAVDAFEIPQYTFDELTSFEIDALEPERTLLEKLAALHTLASRAEIDREALGTKMRHAYDVAMLLRRAEAAERLRALDVEAILADIKRHSVANDWEWTDPPARGFSQSPAFGRDFLEHPFVVQAYDQALALVFGGPRPSLKEVAALVHLSGELL